MKNSGFHKMADNPSQSGKSEGGYISQLITLDQIIKDKFHFNVPIYQRLYVWEKTQIDTLLDDIVQACKAGKTTFYLGGCLVINRKNGDSSTLDLIDGQQRFTTLWLISMVLRGELCDFLKDEKGIRIGFSIRENVNKFLEKICVDGNQEGTNDNKDNQKTSEIQPLETALANIEAYFNNNNFYNSDKESAKNNKERTKSELADFIRHHVKLVVTFVPEHEDLNKLFEVINNRGVQLQHHEILKARLLEKIDDEEKEYYTLLWDICANMDNYIERNLRKTLDKNVLELCKLSNTGNGIDEDTAPDTKTIKSFLANPDDVLQALKNHYHPSDGQKDSQTGELKLLSLKEILETGDEQENKQSANQTNSDSDADDKVESIIKFPMLLQHVLRLYLSQKNADDIDHISDKDLLQIFKSYWPKTGETDRQSVKEFFKLLWQIRYLFDEYIIKWTNERDDRFHALRPLKVDQSKGEISRRHANSDSEKRYELLQSMLYHSQQKTTQYWLTPFLNFLRENAEEFIQEDNQNTEKSYLIYLRYLENHLFCSEDSNEEWIKRTWRFIKTPWYSGDALKTAESCFGQQFDNGTAFPHYWFYKLEYVLYCRYSGEFVDKNSDQTQQAETDLELKNLIEKYRMTSKNSVEHVGAQHAENSDEQLPDNLLHCFGNLALVTARFNSEMSNALFDIKKAKFNSRDRGHGVSLKLEDIYRNEKWGEKEVKAHQKDMTKFFQNYLDKVESDADNYLHTLQNRKRRIDINRGSGINS